MLDIDIIELLTLFLAFVGIWQYLTKSDEFPLLIILFFYLTGIARYNAVMSGYSKWAYVAYAYNIFEMNEELAIQALNYFFLGTAVFVITYIIASSNRPTVQIIDNHSLLSQFLKKNQKLIIGMYIFFLIFNAFSNRVLEQATQGTAYGLSYFFLFKFAIGGLILLFFILFKDLPKDKIFLKIIYLVLIVFASFSSYNPTSRFQFLSWTVALLILIVGSKSLFSKSIFYAVGGVVIIVAFMIAGNLRHRSMQNKDFETTMKYAYGRMMVAEDQNMLDGFMMVLQVYPKHLEFGYGMEHFEILLRPIPRALWPDKPVGGYANKLKLNEGMYGYTTVGISQSIYGTFYGEGGVLGIILFSIIYGILFNKLFISTRKYGSDMRYLLHGIIFCSAIPILRGGDLPGIVSFIGMSFWPVFGFLWLYRRWLRKL
ncbi:MAG: oligosaccharide repeat unit polymerase [Bacteroidales bacterium]|nr:oligosaccharide repeat unit polymerase [Bacteroidales bacterium]